MHSVTGVLQGARVRTERRDDLICHTYKERYAQTKEFMTTKKAVGRPNKVNYRMIIRLADAITHNTNITDSCRYVGISRDTYYRHFNSNPVFAEQMTIAKTNRDKVVFSFLTIP